MPPFRHPHISFLNSGNEAVENPSRYDEKRQNPQGRQQLKRGQEHARKEAKPPGGNEKSRSAGPPIIGGINQGTCANMKKRIAAAEDHHRRQRLNANSKRAKTDTKKSGNNTKAVPPSSVQKPSPKGLTGKCHKIVYDHNLVVTARSRRSEKKQGNHSQGTREINDTMCDTEQGGNIHIQKTPIY